MTGDSGEQDFLRWGPWLFVSYCLGTVVVGLDVVFDCRRVVLI